MTKLTLSVDEDVVKQAKRLAKENGGSVSSMFTNFVRSMANSKKNGGGIGPLTREATGLVTWPEGKTDREILEEALMEHYGLKP